MSLLLLLPAALGALLALLLPLLIHLARREQQRPTTFAALRWLRERPKPRKRIRFDEWPLLLLRLLLLALLALWLARPVLTGAPDVTPWTVVAPGVDADDVARMVESGEGERRWLAAGYPPLSSSKPETPQPIASLLRELDAALPPEAVLTVFVPERLAGLDGAPIRLSRVVEWRVLPGESPLPAMGEGTLEALVVRHGDQRQDEVRYLRAAVLALQPDAPANDVFDVAPAGTPLPADASRIAWLAPGLLPPEVRAWIEQGGQALLAHDVVVEWPGERSDVAWRDAQGTVLVEGAALGRGRILRLRQPLQPSRMPQLLEPDFPHRLHALFDAASMPTRATAEAVAPAQGGPSWLQAPRDLQPWLAVLLALLVLLERWLATSPRRQVRT